MIAGHYKPDQIDKRPSNDGQTAGEGKAHDDLSGRDVVVLLLVVYKLTGISKGLTAEVDN